MLEDNENIPLASDPADLATEKGAFVAPVEGRLG
jgi:hypothetical protein